MIYRCPFRLERAFYTQKASDAWIIVYNMMQMNRISVIYTKTIFAAKELKNTITGGVGHQQNRFVAAFAMGADQTHRIFDVSWDQGQNPLSR